jgi:hypothetical protein
MTRGLRVREWKGGDVPSNWHPEGSDELGDGSGMQPPARRAPMMGKFANPSHICRIVSRESPPHTIPSTAGRDLADHQLAIPRANW